MIMKKIMTLSVFCALAGLSGCMSLASMDQGPGTEVIGRVVFPDDTSAVHGIAILRNSDYLADTAGNSGNIAQMSTDSRGVFDFTSVLPGAYTIEAIDSSHGSRRYAAFTTFTVQSGQQRLMLSDKIMEPCGAIDGRFGIRGGGWVQIYGLDRLARVDSGSGSFALYNLPAGIFTLRFVPASGSQPRTVSGVAVTSGDTLQMPYAAWQFSRRLYLNTTVSGAGIAGDVVDFPVLVRLTSATMPFGQADAAGADVRFTKSDGKPLAFTIEQWDSARGQAEIWVKTDTVYGGDSSHFIVMYWGATTTSPASASNAAAVFDTGAGFTGVWHFSPPDTLGDATPNGFALTDSGSFATETGTIGWGRVFDGAHSFSSVANDPRLNITGNLTLSAWVKLADDTSDQKIMGKSDLYSGYILGIFRGSVDAELWDAAGNHYNIYAPGLTKNTWIHVAMTWTRGRRFVAYINGGAAGSVAAGTADIATGSGPLTIGAAPFTNTSTKFYCNGEIDEARISSAARSADWIRLCYMNQKSPDALVVFK
jgi:hypothetical protein